jgi:hypothetical protein
MATRILESRFEHMSVNDENDPGDGSKYQKPKVNSLNLVDDGSVTDPIPDYLYGSSEFSIIPEFRSNQSPEDCITKPKHSKHDCDRSFPSSTMARVKYAHWIRVASRQNNINFI